MSSAPLVQVSPASAEPRGSWLARVVNGGWTDLRQGVRQMRKNMGITAAMLVTLALCIGATTAIFSMVYSLMLKPLPFDEPARIVELFDSAPKAGLNKLPSNVVQYLDYAAHAKSYQTLALWRLDEGMYGEEGAVTRIAGAQATGEIFGLLRLKPVIGRFSRGRTTRKARTKWSSSRSRFGRATTRKTRV